MCLYFAGAIGAQADNMGGRALSAGEIFDLTTLCPGPRLVGCSNARGEGSINGSSHTLSGLPSKCDFRGGFQERCGSCFTGPASFAETAPSSPRRHTDSIETTY